MELKYILVVVLFSVGVGAELCPKECDCDMDNGLNRAMCVDQNIITIDMGVPKEVQVYSLSHNVISGLDNFCFKVSNVPYCLLFNVYFNVIVNTCVLR